MVARAIVLLPLALTMSLFPLPYVGGMMRVLILVSVAPGVLYLAQGLRRTETWWAGVTFLYLLATFCSALFAVDNREALLDIVRQIYIVFVSLLLMLSLRNPVSRAALARGMAFMAVVAALEIFVLYVSYAGFSFSGLADLEAFKSYAQYSLDVPLNPLSFAMLLAFLLAYPALSRRRGITAVVAVVVLAAMVLAGSRSTLLVFLFGSLVVGLVNAIRKQPLWLRQIVYFFAIPGLVVAGAYLLSTLNLLVDLSELSDLTTGRTDLWAAAVAAFADKPLTGWGAGFHSVNLAAYLSSPYDPWRLETLTSGIEVGAFHNVYLTVLAQKGLIVFIPAMAMAAFLIWQSWRLRVHKANFFRRRDAECARVAPLIVVLILVRGFSEYAGWWGAADGTVDYLSYVGASLIVAMAARLDRIAYPKWAKKGSKETHR
jgi:O-antigen ligase